MKSRSLLALLLALCLCLAPVSAYAAEDGQAANPPKLGDEMPDFSFTTFDGNEYTLSEVLKDKQMVLLNLWATWCGPCEAEFPFMEQAYEQYKDSVEIFALSVEPDDTDEVLAEYVDGHGMTFPVGRDENGLGDIFVDEGIPTSVVIDRFGVICAIEVGSQTALENFTLLFDTFTGEEYTASTVLDDGFPKPPPATPTVEPTDEAELTEALLAEGVSEITVTNPDDEYNWPMTVAEDGDRSCLASSNAGTNNSNSAVALQFSAKAGDALAFDYKVSTEAGYDFLSLVVGEDSVKTFSGEKDWGTYAYVFEQDGDYTAKLNFNKDEMEAGGSDTVWLDNVRIATGDEVDEILASLPTYPHSEATTVTVANEDAKQVVFDDPDNLLSQEFGSADFFIVPGDTAIIRATLGPDSNPETTNFYNIYDNSSVLMSECVDGDGYTFNAVGIDSMETTGYSYGYAGVDGDNDYMLVVYFADEPNVNAFAKEYAEYLELDEPFAWTYADGTEPSTDEVAVAPEDAETEVPEGCSSYQLVFKDENGEPVEGVIANVCDDEACTPMTSGEDGVIEFVYPSFAYHIQVIKVPDGYEYDTSEESYLEEAGGVTEFTVPHAQ